MWLAIFSRQQRSILPLITYGSSDWYITGHAITTMPSDNYQLRTQQPFSSPVYHVIRASQWKGAHVTTWPTPTVNHYNLTRPERRHNITYTQVTNHVTGQAAAKWPTTCHHAYLTFSQELTILAEVTRSFRCACSWYLNFYLLRYIPVPVNFTYF